MSLKQYFKKTHYILITVIITSIIVGFFMLIMSFVFAQQIENSSKEEFCIQCHTIYPAIQAHRDDVHGGKNKVGFKAHCADCHLPQGNVFRHVLEKSKTGTFDLISEIFFDKSKIDWEKIREDRKDFVFDSGCLKCHSNFESSIGFSQKAFVAHRPIVLKTVNKQCVECHKHVGHKNLKFYFDLDKAH